MSSTIFSMSLRQRQPDDPGNDKMNYSFFRNLIQTDRNEIKNKSLDQCDNDNSALIPIFINYHQKRLQIHFSEISEHSAASFIQGHQIDISNNSNAQAAVRHLFRALNFEIQGLGEQKYLCLTNGTIIDQRVEKYKSRIVVKFGSKIQCIKTEELAYVHCVNKICYLVLNNGKKYPSAYKMKDLEQMLNPQLYFRINRQYIVHLDSIGPLYRHKNSGLSLTLHGASDQKVRMSPKSARNFKLWIASGDNIHGLEIR